MLDITKELANTVRFHARVGYENALHELAKATFDEAIKQDNCMHIGVLDESELETACAQSVEILAAARNCNINTYHWMKWCVTICSTTQAPKVFIVIDFKTLMSEKELGVDYVYANVDEADEVEFDPVEGEITHNVSESPIGKVVASYVCCTFHYEKLSLPLIEYHTEQERISAEAKWEYQIVGANNDIDLCAIALNMRLLKHTADRMNLITGKELYSAISQYYIGLFYRYNEAERDANLFTKKIRGVYVGNEEIESRLRLRLRRIDKVDNEPDIDEPISKPEIEDPFNQDFGWVYEE